MYRKENFKQNLGKGIEVKGICLKRDKSIKGKKSLPFFVPEKNYWKIESNTFVSFRF